MKNIKRALRKHHYHRIKKKWLSILKNNEWLYRDNLQDEWFEQNAASHATTHTSCSNCIAHTNPRNII